MHRTRNLFRYWWVSLVVGILSIVTGICCFAVPVDSLAVMTAFFIAVLVVAGIVNVFWAFANREWNDSWGWSLARGLLEILFGVWLLLMPLPLVTTMLIYVVGFWMLFHSVLGICEASELSGIGVRGWGWAAGLQHPEPDLLVRLPGSSRLWRHLHTGLCRGVVRAVWDLPHRTVVRVAADQP